MSAASKVGVGGVGGAAGEASGGGGGGSGDEGGGGGSAGPGRRGDGSLEEGFTPKKWFGIGMLAAGVAAVAYVLWSVRRAKKLADEAAANAKQGQLAPGGVPPPPSSMR
jgi:hypothetical protein